MHVDVSQWVFKFPLGVMQNVDVFVSTDLIVSLSFSFRLRHRLHVKAGYRQVSENLVAPVQTNSFLSLK